MCLNRKNTLLFDIILGLLEDFRMQIICALPGQQDGRTMPVRVTCFTESPWEEKERLENEARCWRGSNNLIHSQWRSTRSEPCTDIACPAKLCGAEPISSGWQTPKQMDKTDL